MPVLYILPANQVVKIKPSISITEDRIKSKIGTPNGIRAIITIGEVNGIIENQKAILLVGSTTTC